MAFDRSNLDDYNPVSARITEFGAKYPTGSLQPADKAVPYRLELIDGKTYFVVVAAAYRTPDDPCPGIGMALEPVPGATSYTKDSELQNAETAAWGRAIVAALAADTRKGVASRDEVRNRSAAPVGPAGESAATSGLVARINAIPNGARARAMKAVVAQFGPPADIGAERLAEAEALVATFEAPAPVLAGVNGNGKAA